MDGLIIKKKWIDLILEGRKTIEIRGHVSYSHMDGFVYLLESGTQLVRGTVRIEGFFTIPNERSWNDAREMACLGDVEYHELVKRYSDPVGYYLCEPNAMNPVKYLHPAGAVVWVKDVEKLIAGGVKNGGKD